MEALNQDLAIFGIASKTLRGQSVSGDTSAFIAFPDGVLVAAIDGLGHGMDAAQRPASKQLNPYVPVLTRLLSQW